MTRQGLASSAVESIEATAVNASLPHTDVDMRNHACSGDAAVPARADLMDLPGGLAPTVSIQ
jgi:hypothetical protein